MSSARRVLFVVNGLGLGNSTRCHAVIQRLEDKGFEVSIVTSGNGVWYFSQFMPPERIHEIESLFYAQSEGGLSMRGTLASIPALAAVQRRNAEKLDKLADALKPGIAVLDSMYSLRAFKKRGVPVAALNNSDVVVSLYRTFGATPRATRAQFCAVEYSDYIFHKFAPDFVISPDLTGTAKQLSPKFSRVGPIVRKNYAMEAGEGAPANAAVMLSGSTFGTKVAFQNSSFPVHIDVVGRERPPGAPVHEKIKYHGKITDTLPILQKADVAVVNGGFSAVSEMVCMQKPVVVVPVPNHAEQWVNAMTVQSMGVGVAASESTYESAMFDMLANADKYREAYRRLGAAADGAGQAASLIEQAVNWA